MEWLVPILFVLASLAQWWMQRNRQGAEEDATEVQSRSAPPRREPPPQEEFGDLGDLLEALGRRRHESPPPTIQPTEPPAPPPLAPAKIPLPKREIVTAPIPEPVLIPDTPRPAPVAVFTAFPEAKPSPMGAPDAAFALDESPRMNSRPFPMAEKPGVFTPHRWAEKLRSSPSAREAIILSEILAPPLSLR